MEIQVEEIKEFLDACHKAKRIAEMMPELPEGMTPRHVHVIDAIYQLERTGEMVKVSDVSEYLEVTRPSITRLIRELETLGAVSKIADTQDKRIVWLELTDLGHRYYDKYIRRYFSWIGRQLEDMEPEELLTAAGAIERVYGILSNRSMEDTEETQEDKNNGEFEKKIDAKLVLSILAAGIMSFSGVVVETAMNVTFPTLMKEFGIGTSMVQWITTGYLLILAVIIPASSYLKKRFTTKALFVTAISLFIVGTVMAAVTPVFSLLLVGRLIQGVGTGIALPLMFNIVLEQVPEDKLGFMMGLASLITAMAPAVDLPSAV